MPCCTWARPFLVSSSRVQKKSTADQFFAAISRELMSKPPAMNSDVLLYFAYGSNLLAERIHANNPSATRKGIGKLNGYRLDFGFKSVRWNGSVATIVPDPDSYVWGAIWEINISDIPNLDKQEGVANKVYEVINVNPETLDQRTVTCRSYQLRQLPPKIIDGKVPEDRKPSLTYLSVILKGAKESQLPECYIKQLQKIEHNGRINSDIKKIMLTEEEEKV